MSAIGKILKFVPRSEIAESRLGRALFRDAAKEAEAFDLVRGVTEPINLGGKGSIRHILEPADSQARKGRFPFNIYTEDTKGKYSDLTNAFLGKDGFSLMGGSKYDNKAESGANLSIFEDLLERLNKKNKEPNVFFADGTQI